MATTYQTSFTGSNRKNVPPWSSGDLVAACIPSGTTVNTTSSGTSPLDTAGDFLVLWDIPDGAKLKNVHLDVADLDTDGSPAFDADLVLRIDNGGTVTDTVLLNAGTSFQSAYKAWTELQDQYVDASGVDAADYYGKIGQVGLKVVTQAATGVAAGSIKGTIIYQ